HAVDITRLRLRYLSYSCILRDYLFFLDAPLPLLGEMWRRGPFVTASVVLPVFQESPVEAFRRLQAIRSGSCASVVLPVFQESPVEAFRRLQAIRSGSC
nr:hypothetical protein [Tanacetum cinerariifolium]